ncbi:MAG: ribonuclease E/G [Minwuia sp.]|uniref:ribonuclease E/G n=1 Tax=Minwuia sp. TaxID=2493630 RepID=UPI003A87E416
MNRSLYIDSDLMETRLAVIEDERIAEIHLERPGGESGIGEIRRARVTHISNDLQAATLDAGDGISLFLRATDAKVLAGDGEGRKPAISKLVQRGQLLTVQTGRDAADGKQARASADIALAGRYLILHPMRRGLESGKRPPSGELEAALTPLAGEAGLVIRPPAHAADVATVAAEAERLVAEWREATETGAGKPGLLRAAPGLLERAFLQFAGAEPETVLTPDRGLRADLIGLAKRIAPDIADRIELCDADRPLDLDEEIASALSQEVESGGVRLIIETTAAMTTVDVDGRGEPRDVNVKAAREIARQLRLRRIGGPVAVDFVSMSRAPDRKKVETALRQAVARDPEPVDIGTIDRFGIATLVRRRSGLSLAAELCEAPVRAPHFSPSAALARVLRRVTRELDGVGPLPMRIELSEDLADAAGDDLAARLSARLGRPLTVAFGSCAVDAFALTRER